MKKRPVLGMNRHQRRKQDSIRRHRPQKSVGTLLIAPVFLSFEKAPHGTREFFQKLDNMSDDGEYRVTLRDTKYIDLGAALVLAAMFHRWRLNCGATLLEEDILLWPLAVRKKLNSLGFFKMLGIREGRTIGVSPREEHNTWIRMISDVKTLGEHARQLRKKLQNLLGTHRTILVYAPLIEAMKNAIEHAYWPYRKSELGVSGERWWMTGDYDAERGLLQIAFTDLGSTIPGLVRCLPVGVQRMWKNVPLKDCADAEITVACMFEGVSRKGQNYRGKGFGDILKVVGASVVVLSGRALVYYGGEEGHKGWKGWEDPTSFNGTLIRWFINVGEMDDGT